MVHYEFVENRTLQALARHATDAMREGRVLDIIHTVSHYSLIVSMDNIFLANVIMPLHLALLFISSYRSKVLGIRMLNVYCIVVCKFVTRTP